MTLPKEEYEFFLNDKHSPLVNIGCGVDVTFAQWPQSVCELVGYKGNLVLDTSKPDGKIHNAQVAECELAEQPRLESKYKTERKANVRV